MAIAVNIKALYSGSACNGCCSVVQWALESAYSESKHYTKPVVLNGGVLMEYLKQ